MLTQELIKKVKKIEIQTRRVIDEITGGAYHSAFKGRGIEFEEVREYTPEDDVRDIDWNVTARMGQPFIKKYVEERELNVILAVDISASGDFGSNEKTKREQAIEIAALLAFSAIRNNDKVGLLLFSDHTECYLPPRSSRSYGLRIIRELLAISPKHKKTNISSALEELSKGLTKKSIIFLISDFIDEGFEKTLKILNKKHDVIAVRTLDSFEIKFPKTANFVVEDAETGESHFFSGRHKGTLEQFSKLAQEYHDKQRDICRRAKVDMIDLRCDQDVLSPLVNFFKRRQRRH